MIRGLKWAYIPIFITICTLVLVFVVQAFSLLNSLRPYMNQALWPQMRKSLVVSLIEVNSFAKSLPNTHPIALPGYFIPDLSTKSI